MSERRPHLRVLRGGVPEGLIEPIAGPYAPGAEAEPVRGPRLRRETLTLPDGHQVGLAVSGRGIPLVVVHGFMAEGFLYAQTLSRLVSMGYKVVAIDAAGHGGTQGLPTGGGRLEDYADLLRRCIDELGIRRAILAGHSMGGRLVADLAADHPHRAIAVILLDAIVGDTWDRMMTLFRLAPPALAALGMALALDTARTMPVFGDPRQATKLFRLLTPTVAGNVRRPWRLIGPGISLLRSANSRDTLEKLAAADVPVFAIHGDRDFGVPLRTAEDAIARTGGRLVVVHGGTHSWLLRDPETLPAIVYDLVGGELGVAQRFALRDAGLVPGTVSVDDVEGALYEPDALALELTPDPDPEPADDQRVPRYEWTVASQA